MILMREQVIMDSRWAQSRSKPRRSRALYKFTKIPGKHIAAGLRWMNESKRAPLYEIFTSSLF